MHYSKRKNDPFIKEGGEWKCSLSRPELTRVAISRNLWEAVKRYKELLGIPIWGADHGAVIGGVIGYVGICAGST